MARRSLQLAPMHPVGPATFGRAAEPLALQHHPPTTLTAALEVRAPAAGALPVIAQLKQYLALRNVGEVAALPETERFPVASPDNTKADVALPFGVPRHVSAGTLKRLAGGTAADTMLELINGAWDFVSDDARIDLKDRSRVFRVGRALILS